MMSPSDLKAARKRLGMSQKALAAALKIRSGDRTIRNMETGRVPVSGPVEVAVIMMLERLDAEEGEVGT